jgi:uncharacterized damage-inducible protein DinB
MNSLQTIRTIVADANGTLTNATNDLPAALVNKRQPGQSNTIGAIYAHAVLTLDSFYLAFIQGKAQLIDENGRASALGLQNSANLNWETLNATNWDWEALQRYAQAVTGAVDAYLASLTEAELGRSCQIFGQDATVAQTIAIATWHTALHAGEIAALKGVNELKGLPF